jgi:Calx-beta domain/FG-GAP-like repeat/FG-GAP repeat
MSFTNWLQNHRSALAPGRGQRQHRRRGSLRAAMRRPYVEVLEDRTLLSFSAAVGYATGYIPTAVVTADFNGDGRLDLAVANTGSHDVSILLGSGDGAFQAARNYSAANGSPESLAVGDFNRDGKLDLVTANGGVGEVSVLLGNGNSTFQPARATRTGLSTTIGVAVGDFNADGKLDLAVTGQNPGYPGGYGYYGGYYPGTPPTGKVAVFMGHGDGTLAAPSYVYQSDLWFNAIATADFNGDGKPELVWTEQDAVGVLLGNGNGTFAASAQNFATGDSPDSLAVADLNGDGKLDLVTANADRSASVLLGKGDGAFQAARDYAIGSGSGFSGGVAVADFNGDGKPDLVQANVADDSVGVLLGNDDGSFRNVQFYQAGSGADGVAAGDFNGDGRPDLAVADELAGVSVLLNTGEGAPLPPSLRINDVTVAEGNTGTVAATFAVTLSAASAETITVAYATGNDTAAAGSDYTSKSGTLTFAPGVTSKTVTVLVNGDRIAEPSETFVVNLSAPVNAGIADSQGIGTILDNEPRIRVSDVTKTEGTGKNTTLFVFTVTLSTAYDQAVTMSFRTVDGTATSGSGDYIAKTGTLTFAPGETTKTITIEVKGDSKKEANEAFYLDLFGNSGNSLFTKNRGIGQILNDD